MKDYKKILEILKRKEGNDYVGYRSNEEAQAQMIVDEVVKPLKKETAINKLNRLTKEAVNRYNKPINYGKTLILKKAFKLSK